MATFLKALKEDIIEAIPGIIFFVISFNLINFTEKLMLRQYDLDLVSCLTATIAGLLVGKLLIIVNAIPYINMFPRKPLIYNISWKIFIYSTAALILRCLHQFIHYYWHYHDATTAWMHVRIHLMSAYFWSIQLWLVMLFVVYTSAAEFSRALGKGKVKKLLFG